VSSRGNWIKTMPGKGWFLIVRALQPARAFLHEGMRSGEIEF